MSRDGLADTRKDMETATQTTAGGGPSTANVLADADRLLASIAAENKAADERSKAALAAFDQDFPSVEPAAPPVEPASAMDAADGASADRSHAGGAALDISLAGFVDISPEPPAADQEATSADADDAEIDILAGLDPLTYDRERQRAAERLRVRSSTLDELVKRRRQELGHTGIEDSTGSGRALQLPEPEPWPHAVNGGEVLDEVRAAISSIVVLSEYSSAAVALWVMFTHLIDQFDIGPRLLTEAPTWRCGKSTLVEVIGELVPRSLMASNITPAAVFRTIEVARPTLLIDEADTFIAKNEELRGVLNSGHKRSNAQVVRVVEIDGEHELRAFSTWCAMVIAGIGKQHSTINDRSSYKTSAKATPTNRDPAQPSDPRGTGRARAESGARRHGLPRPNQ